MKLPKRSVVDSIDCNRRKKSIQKIVMNHYMYKIYSHIGTYQLNI